ncbi:MAG: CBS domain-containing protein [Kiritimatiellales bacterium]|nr:CBS domain-containing protein [Kiritimatiellales bacterium]
MKTNLKTTTVKDIAYLINTSCLRADRGASLEKLADMLCVSDRYKVYLEADNRQLIGVIQAKQIAMKILELSRQKDDEQEMLPAIAYVLNFQCGGDLGEPPVTVQAETSLKQVLELMDQNQIREIAVVDAENHLVGTLEAKNILAHYLHAKAETSL